MGAVDRTAERAAHARIPQREPAARQSPALIEVRQNAPGGVGGRRPRPPAAAGVPRPLGRAD